MPLSEAAMKKAQSVKLIISDVDGVLTDGSIIIGSDGSEFKRFTVIDGVGVALAKMAGLQLAFLSGRYSGATLRRIKEFKLEQYLWQGKLNKIDSYQEIKQRFNRNDNEIAYIGDDLIDLPVLKKAGFAAAVSNSPEYIKEQVDFVTTAEGGKGAFRELVDEILKAQEIYQSVFEKMRRTVYNEKN